MKNPYEDILAIRLGGSPPYPSPSPSSTSNDATTERMRRETGHDCIVCSGVVRDLMATAHNLLDRLDASDWSGVTRERESMRRSLANLRRVADMHFEVLDGWRRP